MKRAAKPARISNADRLTARDVLARIERRHTRDVWFSEVKDGPTWFDGHLRIDGLAIAKTWSPPRFTGYEVKVSRGDWLRDHKFEAYMPLCHVLYVVSANGAVQAEELPESVGLIEAVGTKGLRTVRKAAYRPIELPGDLMLYLLMSRVRAVREHEGMSREARIAMWADRLASNRSGREIGYSVSNKIREQIARLEVGGTARAAEYMQTVEEWLTNHKSSPWGDLRSRLDAALIAERAEIDRARECLDQAVAHAIEKLRTTAERVA